MKFDKTNFSPTKKFNAIKAYLNDKGWVDAADLFEMIILSALNNEDTANLLFAWLMNQVGTEGIRDLAERATGLNYWQSKNFAGNVDRLDSAQLFLIDEDFTVIG